MSYTFLTLVVSPILESALLSTHFQVVVSSSSLFNKSPTVPLKENELSDSIRNRPKSHLLPPIKLSKESLSADIHKMKTIPRVIDMLAFLKNDGCPEEGHEEARALFDRTLANIRRENRKKPNNQRRNDLFLHDEANKIAPFPIYHRLDFERIKEKGDMDFDTVQYLKEKPTTIIAEFKHEEEKKMKNEKVKPWLTRNVTDAAHLSIDEDGKLKADIVDKDDEDKIIQVSVEPFDPAIGDVFGVWVKEPPAEKNRDKKKERKEKKAAKNAERMAAKKK